MEDKPGKGTSTEMIVTEIKFNEDITKLFFTRKDMERVWCGPGKNLSIHQMVSAPFGEFSFFVSYAVYYPSPLYQYLNGVQVGSQYQFTIGVNYRFLTKECESEILPLPK